MNKLAKKFIAIALVLMLMFSVVACGAADTEEKNGTEETESIAPDETSDEVTEEVTEEETEPEEPTEEVTEPVVARPEFSKTTQIEETVLYNEQDILITATKMSYTDNYVKIEFSIENNSTEDYSFTSGPENIIVNGVMIPDGYVNCKVGAGKKAKDTIDLSYRALMLCGVFEINSLSVGFEIVDDDYKTQYVAPVLIPSSVTDPDGDYGSDYQEAIVSDSMQKEFRYSVSHFSADMLLQIQDVKVLSQCVILDQDGGTTLLLEVANDSEDPVRFRISAICLNDLVVYGGGNWTTELIYPGCRSIVDIDLSNVMEDGYREIYGITDIASVAVSAELCDIEYKDMDYAGEMTVRIPGIDASFDPAGDVLYSDDDFKIVFKTITDGLSEYDDSAYILLLAENKSDYPVTLTDEYNTFSVNGYMSDCSVYSVNIGPNQSAVIEIQIHEYMFEDSGITQASDIGEFELEFVLRDNDYHKIESFYIHYPQQ